MSNEQSDKSSACQPDADTAWFTWRNKFPDASPYEIFVAAFGLGAVSSTPSSTTSSSERIDFNLEEYIAGLKWSDQATDHEKTLVIGNLRGMFAIIRERHNALARMALELSNAVVSSVPSATTLTTPAAQEQRAVTASGAKNTADTYREPVAAGSATARRCAKCGTSWDAPVNACPECAT